ncbi:MAG: phosphopentomutase [Erysipelotrichaceae bacterium]|nr:phosphopentomutase [Erysipelotrichaceae bacterium]
MKRYKRIFTIVIDSVGIGAAPDAAAFDDVGCDTIGHCASAVGGLYLPVLESLGLGNLHEIMGVAPSASPRGYFTKMIEKSVSKDTMTGHWEMMGLYIDQPFKTFTDTGFPDELIAELEEKTGHKIIGNYAASGTEIIEELGERHIETGEMIVYTSADSVLQIACSEETFGLDELYRCCEIAREITKRPEYKLGRVIARPFVGKKKGEFKRTANRHDYALKPYGHTVLDSLKAAGYESISVGKIFDIFDGEGLTESNKSQSSDHGMKQTIAIMDRDFTGMCFTNLVDFDALWGHRRNPQGYAKELETFDANLEVVLSKLRDDDLVIITADHGNDPTYKGTDHTRENVPFIAYAKDFKGSGLLPVCDTFADLGATVADNFEIEMPQYGKSLLSKLI